MISLIRIIKFAFQDLVRNFGLSLVTIFVLILMLLSVNTLWAIDGLTQEAIQSVKEQVNLSFYLSPDVSSKDIAEIKNYVQSFKEVTDLKILSSVEVLQTFQKRHQGSAEVLEALSELGGNPFGPTLLVKTKEPGDYKKIIEALNVPEYEHLIEAKSFGGHEEAIDRIQNITDRVEKIGLSLSLFFALIAFLIIFNTIQIAIFTQHIEIGIKRLVGANNWFIRGPYIVESAFFSLVSVAISAILFWFALRWADPYVSVIFTNGFSLTKYYYAHILWLVTIQASVVLLLTMISSSLAMRRQLKV